MHLKSAIENSGLVDYEPCDTFGQPTYHSKFEVNSNISSFVNYNDHHCLILYALLCRCCSVFIKLVNDLLALQKLNFKLSFCLVKRSRIILELLVQLKEFEIIIC